METVFDLEITPKEITELDILMGETKEDYLRHIGKDIALADIVRLMVLRGDKVKALEYLDEIDNKDLRTSILAKLSLQPSL